MCVCRPTQRRPSSLWSESRKPIGGQLNSRGRGVRDERRGKTGDADAAVGHARQIPVAYYEKK